jgi:hypothetical protein
MRQLGASPPEPPPGETDTDVETPSQILPHERHSLEAEEPFRVEVYRIERKPIEPAHLNRLPEAEVAQTPPRAEPPVPMEEEVAKKEANDATAAAGRGEEFRAPEQNPTELREPAVEVHRIDLNPVEVETAAPLQAMEVPDLSPEVISPAATPQATKKEEETAGKAGKGEVKGGIAPLGRWEEFHEPRGLKPVTGDRIHVEPVPLQQGFSSRLLTADLEREPRSSFLILVVLGIGIALVVGALWWKGWIPTRVKQRDAEMSALQEQNRKLADTVAQMSVKPPIDAAGAPQNGVVLQQPKTAQDEHPAQSGHSELPVHRPSQSGRLQGVSVPPPMQSPVRGQRRSSMPQKGSLYDHPPEIVPPYPTLAQSQNTGANAAGSQPVPNTSAYRAPFTPGAYQQPVQAAGAPHPGTSPGTTSRAVAPPAATAPRLQTPSAVSNSTPAPTSSNATQYDAGIGSYANLLAQNVETVEGLQRHSAVQLREFHARAGVSTQTTPTVRLSVQHPDQSSGSYALVVAEGGSSYQLRGEVNVPLAFADTSTHRKYGLVILTIAGQQVYGYVRATQ